VDGASPVLGRLRAEVRTAHTRLIDKLNSILTSSAYADAIQDALITVRDGRYVIPIKSEARNKLRSIVHDQSSSGATLFVEPLITGKVVPTTIKLGGDFSILVITGPNTGGKTVALKTAGLLTLMALAGLQIPADHGSTVRVFDAVHADIGDEQSIEQSLSTFS